MRLGKPDFTFTVNGCLAGLVAITAPCAFVTPGSAVSIGAIAGVLVIEAVLLFDRLKIDDPVGATSVHLVNGVFGTLAVGLFGVKGLSGLANDGLLRGRRRHPAAGSRPRACSRWAAFTFSASIVAWSLIKAVMGARVDRRGRGRRAWTWPRSAWRPTPTPREIEEKVRAVQARASAPTGVVLPSFK